MEFTIEDILSAIGAAIVVCISIMTRSGRKNAKRGSNTPPMPNVGDIATEWQNNEMGTTEKESFPSIGRVFNYHYKENRSHHDSAEEIVEEVDSKAKQKKTKKARNKNGKQMGNVAQNATNRTSASKSNSEPITVAVKDGKRKFNLRDAVIYSEILTPKFKEKE